MATVQVTSATREALQARKQEHGLRSLDAVVQELLHPRPRKDTVLARLRLVAPALRQMGVERLRLVGSVAHDDAHAGSDIDLLVDLDDDRDYSDLARLQRFLEAALAAPCDLVLPAALHPRLATDILASAQEVKLG